MARHKWTYLEVKSYIESFSYTLLSTEYINNRTNLLIQCDKGHVFKKCFSSFQKGERCSICNKNNKNLEDFKKVKSYIESFDYILLSKEYIDSKTNLLLKCPLGHIFSKTFNSFQQGQRCSVCYNINRRLVFDELKQIAAKNGDIILSKKYIDNKTEMFWKCSKDHNFKMDWGHYQRGYRCVHCSNAKHYSKGEKNLLEFVKTIYTGKIKSNDHKEIKNPKTGKYLELDILLPDKKLALEYSGYYWHNRPQTIIKDQVKIEQCNKLGIQLLTICEHDWQYGRERCEERIKKFILG